MCHPREILIINGVQINYYLSHIYKPFVAYIDILLY